MDDVVSVAIHECVVLCSMLDCRWNLPVRGKQVIPGKLREWKTIVDSMEDMKTGLAFLENTQKF